MNTNILELALGLVFIYLIYSIFMSLIVEMLSTWMGFRARILKQGITNMLTDLKDQETSNIPEGFVRKLRHFFLLSPKGFHESKAREFYNQASIRYLSQGTKVNFFNHIFLFKKSKPSYISSQTFSATLIHMLREKGRGIHDWGKIKFSVQNNALHFDPNTCQQVCSLLEDADDDMGLFIQKLELWYEEMMDRVNGWYKRKMRMLIFWVGILIAAILNVDSFKIVKVLSKDHTAREQIVELATAAADKDSKMSEMISRLDSQYVEDQLYRAINEISKEVENTDILLGLGHEFPLETKSTSFKQKDELWEKLNTQVKKAMKAQKLTDSLDNELHLEGLEIEEIQELLALKRSVNQDHQRAMIRINTLANSSYVRIDALQKISSEKFELKGESSTGFGGKLRHILAQLNPAKTPFWGFVITALALCLGAPFWFDLLTKLVALRGAGKKPEEKEKKATERIAEAKTVKNKNQGKRVLSLNPVDLVLAKNRDKWLALEGVIAVNKVLIKKENKAIKYVIEVSHFKGFELKEIPDEFKRKKSNQKVEVIKKEREYAEFQGRNHIDEVQQTQLGRTITGTIAGKLLNLDSPNKCILSCGHVLSKTGASLVFNGEQDHSLGKIKKVIWSNTMDAGIIEITKKTEHLFRTIQEVHVPDINDQLNQTPVRIYKRKDYFKDAYIQNIDVDYPFSHKYSKKAYTLYNLISLGSDDGPLTQSGDSGSLVNCFVGPDKLEKTLGIIVGCLNEADGSSISFVLPMHRILRDLNLAIIEENNS
ncbi:MAG: hypothetical protein R8P61_00640 [Bacteroidia bacterium]|nr:hypothetical protein [Bacteroidia bacterium]